VLPIYSFSLVNVPLSYTGKTAWVVGSDTLHTFTAVMTANP